MSGSHHPDENSKCCQDCKKNLDDPQLKLFFGDPEYAVEEHIMVIDPRLWTRSGTKTGLNDVNERQQHRVTNFSVYDRSAHLCAFDDGLIEDNVDLYFSGIVKPIYDATPGFGDGIPTSKMGPVVEWWITGLDSSDAVIHFSTAFADYILMHPSRVYAPFMTEVREKIRTSQIAIKCISGNPKATYEELLSKLEIGGQRQGTSLTEDSLLRHAQFVANQILNLHVYNSCVDESECALLITAPCIRALIDLTGVTLTRRRAIIRRAQTARLLRSQKSVHLPVTTTPLVRYVFESFFHEQLGEDSIDVSLPQWYKRCGICEACQLPDCGKCNFCRDTVKFGGAGKRKQSCAERWCPNIAVQETNEKTVFRDDVNDEMNKNVLLSRSPSIRSPKKLGQAQKVEPKWIRKPIKMELHKVFYGAVCVKDIVVHPGDFVLVVPADCETPVLIAKIVTLWANSNGDAMFHGMWFCRGAETVLGSSCDPSEIFGTPECQDIELKSIHSKINVYRKNVPDNWSKLGGSDSHLQEMNTRTRGLIFYRQWYNVDTARFEDPPYDEKCNDGAEFPSCVNCRMKDDYKKKNDMQMGIILEETDDTVLYKSVLFNSYSYSPGECVLLQPGVYTFLTDQPKLKKETAKEVDENLYPEAYRKNSCIKEPTTVCPDPFVIGYVKKIIMPKECIAVDRKSVKLIVSIFYRPENTHRSRTLTSVADLNLLYWSDKEITVSMDDVQGKCYVKYEENIEESIDEYSSNGPNRFYFNEAYNYQTKDFEMPPIAALKMGIKSECRSKVKGKIKATSMPMEKPLHIEEVFPHITQHLRSLDVFAGCGGLSEGFFQAGLAKPMWAIELNRPAAQAFKLNFPTCTVINDDCDLILDIVMNKKFSCYKGQQLPQKGDIDLLYGEPVQESDQMNKFQFHKRAILKDSVIVSYCDYYRPRFFVLESTSFANNPVLLQFILNCLVKIGYQCTFGVLQTGNYGIPQTRKRIFIFGAAPGEKLPLFPEPLHVARSCQLSVMVDDKKYNSNIKWNHSAPYRAINVRDAISDLPCLQSGAASDIINYDTGPQSNFQRECNSDVPWNIFIPYQTATMRDSMSDSQMNYSEDPQSHFQKSVRSRDPNVYDHICKKMSPLVEARIRHIPPHPDADWRDLPNKIELLCDGTFANELQYTHHDEKNGYGPNEKLRGVCACAEGKPCDPADRQFNTLIPWCLPHTGNLHNHWAGLYGRLDWDGCFSTAITNPEPMGTQGRVLHPEQQRVISVRECARSQGFRDSFRFQGNVSDRYSQIGNAVPPPLAITIGFEIMKCVSAKENSCV